MGLITGYLFFITVTAITSYIRLYLPVYNLLILSKKRNIAKDSPILTSVVFIIMALLFGPLMLLILFFATESFIEGMVKGVEEK